MTGMRDIIGIVALTGAATLPGGWAALAVLGVIGGLVAWYAARPE